MPTVRFAQPADANAMGALHVRAWQSAYRNVMGDEYLDGLDPKERSALWAESISRAPDQVLVAESDGTVIGFAAFGGTSPLSGAVWPSVGELYALNVDPDHWGQGAGRALLTEVIRHFEEVGVRDAVLWVLPSNTRARALYESAGWHADGTERTADVNGAVVAEVRYSYRFRTPLPPIDLAQVTEFWNQLLAARVVPRSTPMPAAEPFGDSVELADELIELVVHGSKRATASALVDYLAQGDTPPQPGSLSIATDGAGRARAVLRTAEVRIGPLSSVDESFAIDEGEGDRTRQTWLASHTRFLSRSLPAIGVSFDPEMDIVFERFEVLFSK